MCMNITKNLSIPKGTCDYIGIDMRVREFVINKIKLIYERFGFIPQDTPILEESSIFNGHHGEGENLIFHLNDSCDIELALRYDLTVPLARVYNMYSHLPNPYKRYQISKSFRDDKVDKGHFREFTQCDADIVGSDCLIADAEIISMAYQSMHALGLNNISLRLNHRGILRGIALLFGLSDTCDVIKMQTAFDRTDKITKDGLQGLIHNLISVGISLSKATEISQIVKSFIGLNFFDAINKLKKEFENVNQIIDGANDLIEIISYLPSDIVKSIRFDLTLARGANYYTGFIIEGVIDNVKTGAVCGGGRYDHLISSVGDACEPAVGMAIGLERVLVALKELEIIHSFNVIPYKLLLIRTEVVDIQRAITLLNDLRNQFNVYFLYDKVINESMSFDVFEGSHEYSTLVFFKNNETIKIKNKKHENADVYFIVKNHATFIEN
jgi:histidyl-tRNA synthetase